MALFRKLRAKARQIAPLAVGACLVAYFAYHAVQGDRGVLALLRLGHELARAEAVEASLAEQRRRLARRVGLLRSDHLDPDMLVEQAHALLNYGHGDEYVILFSGARGARREGSEQTLWKLD